MLRRALLVTMLLVGCVPTPGTPGQPAVETIGALVDASGSAAHVGSSVQAGLNVAVEDVNAYLEGRGAGFRIALQSEDPAPDALAAYGKLKAAGVQAVVGPVTSAAAATLAAPATADGLLLLSPSSTAPSLAIDDNLLRFAPVDVLQGVAIARAMAERDVKASVVLARDDVYGNGLAQEVEYAAGLAGITHMGTVTYAADATSYTEAIAELKAQVEAAEARFGAGKVAIELVSYDEAGQIMKQAQAAGGLDQARWFGCDGNAHAGSIATDAEAAAFARGTQFLASTFVTPAEAKLAVEVDSPLPAPASLAGRVKTDQPLDTFFYTAYDALWTLALTREAIGSLENAQAVKSAIYTRSQTFKGTAGVAALNAQGDRATGHYGFFGLGEAPGAWTLQAVYGNTTYQRLN